MCGIVGYIGEKLSAPIILSSLKRLEYRGYDSCGIATCGKTVYLHKAKGGINEISFAKKFPGHIGIGHTRWATHGAPNQKNAHPFLDCSGEIAICHNGIIENFQELKEQLQYKGHKFTSDTDTEVIAHLVEELYKGDLFETVREVVSSKIKGSYGLVVIHKKEPNRIIAARNLSPIVIGLSSKGNFVASDVTAFLPYTKKSISLSNFEMADIRADKVDFYDLKTGEKVEKEITELSWDHTQAERQGFPHFMLKEIHEQAVGVSETFRGAEIKKELFKKANKIYIVASGTSSHAGLVSKYFLSQAGISSDVFIASEFGNYKNSIKENDLIFAISQSGETADLMASIQDVPCKICALTNVVGSSITRQSEFSFFTRCGPEIGVAATKTFTSQLAAVIALYLSLKDEVPKDISSEIEETIDRLKTGAEYIANELKDAKSVYFLGRGMNYPIALEGALKFKEISYIHGEGLAAGELKHGTLALIEEGTPVVVVATPDKKNYDKIIGNIMEVKARGGKIYSIVKEGDTHVKQISDEVLEVPEVDEIYYPIIASIPLQLIAYYTSVIRGNSPDKPRNLAKSVTVE